jgi:Na+-transporting NADH:ubiquinone oxidoreductase subunit D
MMVLAPAAFLLIGVFIWVLRAYKPEQIEEDFGVGALSQPRDDRRIR